jgi:hypothetical protein
MLTPWRTVVLLAAAACGHDLPPEPTVSRPDSAPGGSAPPRITLNQLMDLTPAYSVDGATLWYSWERNDQADHDLCLGQIPTRGGSRVRQACPVVAGSIGDSANWFISPAPHPDGRRLAWYQHSALYLGHGSAGEIVLGPIDAPNDPSRVVGLQHFPIHTPSGRTLVLPEQLQWADDTTLVFIGVLFTTNDTLVGQDSIYNGLEVNTLTLTGDTAVLGSVDGTRNASGVAVAPGRVIYFTVDGDVTVYRGSLDGGAVEPFITFDSIARDPVMVGDTVYAIVGGEVTWGEYPVVGFLQLDKGGALWRGHAGGVRSLVSNARLYRHPTVSPDRRTIAIEGRDLYTRIQDIYLIDIGSQAPLVHRTTLSRTDR